MGDGEVDLPVDLGPAAAQANSLKGMEARGVALDVVLTAVTTQMTTRGDGTLVARLAASDNGCHPLALDLPPT